MIKKAVEMHVSTGDFAGNGKQSHDTTMDKDWLARDSGGASRGRWPNEVARAVVCISGSFLRKPVRAIDSGRETPYSLSGIGNSRGESMKTRTKGNFFAASVLLFAPTAWAQS